MMVDMKKSMEIFDEAFKDLRIAYSEELAKVQSELNKIDEQIVYQQKRRWAIKSDVLDRAIKTVEEKYKHSLDNEAREKAV